MTFDIYISDVLPCSSGRVFPLFERESDLRPKVAVLIELSTRSFVNFQHGKSNRDRKIRLDGEKRKVLAIARQVIYGRLMAY